MVIRDFVRSLAVLNVFTIEIIELYVKGLLPSTHEKKLKNYLKWNLFKGGIAGVELSQLLTIKNDTYSSKLQASYQDFSGYAFDEKFDALKEDVYSKIGRISLKREKKELDEKLLNELVDGKDPVLSALSMISKNKREISLTLSVKLEQWFLFQ